MGYRVVLVPPSTVIYFFSVMHLKGSEWLKFVS